MKILWLSPNDRHFGIFLPAFTAWLVMAAMPSHAIIHVHIVPRIYFVALLGVAIRFSRRATS